MPTTRSKAINTGKGTETDNEILKNRILSASKKIARIFNLRSKTANGSRKAQTQALPLKHLDVGAFAAQIATQHQNRKHIRLPERIVSINHISPAVRSHLGPLPAIGTSKQEQILRSTKSLAKEKGGHIIPSMLTNSGNENGIARNSKTNKKTNQGSGLEHQVSSMIEGSKPTLETTPRIGRAAISSEQVGKLTQFSSTRAGLKPNSQSTRGAAITAINDQQNEQSGKLTPLFSTRSGSKRTAIKDQKVQHYEQQQSISTRTGSKRSFAATTDHTPAGEQIEASSIVPRNALRQMDEHSNYANDREDQENEYQDKSYNDEDREREDSSYTDAYPGSENDNYDAGMKDLVRHFQPQYTKQTNNYEEPHRRHWENESPRRVWPDETPHRRWEDDEEEEHHHHNHHDNDTADHGSFEHRLTERLLDAILNKHDDSHEHTEHNEHPNLGKTLNYKMFS